MKFLKKIKWTIKSILERHPIGYYLGNKLINQFDLFLPHEEDYYGFKKLTQLSHGLFLDIGANDGKSARSFMKLFKKWRIYSVEANPLHKTSLQKLKKKYVNYDFKIGAIGKPNSRLMLYTPIYKKMVIHSAAAIDLNQVKYQMKKQFRKQHILERMRYKETQTHRIHLDDLNLKPDIIKIDIEGMEHIALQCLEKTIQHNLPILLIEYNPNNYEHIKQLLFPKGYIARGFDIQHNRFVAFNQHRNCFFIPHQLENCLSL